MKAHETFYMDGAKSHYLYNHGNSPAKILWITTPPIIFKNKPEGTVKKAGKPVPMERRTMEEKKLIEFRNIVKSFDSQVVLKGINLDIYENEFVTLLGPSGCGKTTLLRILGGFLDADEGKVIFDNEDITGKPPYERELNTVFQKYALFPHLSVYENIAFGLKHSKK